MSGGGTSLPPELIVIPCSAVKTQVPPFTALPAGELYRPGSYHLACRRAAEALAGTGSTIRVLSALYGLVSLEEPVLTYELRIGQPGAVSAQEVREQAREQGLARPGEVWVLAGRDYARTVTEVWPTALRPLEGTRGIGEQRSRLAQIRRAPSPRTVARSFASPAQSPA
ncbi:DUF6884 domain-containing protein [Streptomyces sp. NPDC001889]